MKRRISSSLALLLAMALMLSACGGNTASTNTDSAVTTSSSSAAVEEEILPTDTSILTGLGIDESRVGLRPIACMMENTKVALPHYNINRAGVIYECPVEGGLTRYMTLFDDYSDIERLGNLRSSRPYYVYLATEYEAIYMHMGGSVQALDLLSTGIIDNLNGLDGIMNDTYYTTSDRKRPHNTYTSTDGIENGIKVKEYTKEFSEGYTGHFQFAKEENTLDEGEDVAVIKEYFFDNKPYFIYDPEKKVYERYEYGQAEVDAVDGNQVAVNNIIFMNIDSSLYGDTLYLNIPLVGKGKGKFFTNGKMVDITWEKEYDMAVTKYYMPDGSEIQLNPGKTWVSLIENKYLENNKFYKSVDEFKSDK